VQIRSEREVLDALAVWVEAHPDQRSGLFEDMFGKPSTPYAVIAHAVPQVITLAQQLAVHSAALYFIAESLR